MTSNIHEINMSFLWQIGIVVLSTRSQLFPRAAGSNKLSSSAVVNSPAAFEVQRLPRQCCFR